MEISGKRGDDHWIPHLLGHEGSGVVLDIGAGVTKVKPGDKVILTWIKGEGIDAEGAQYVSENRIINSGKVTTFSNYTIVSENRIVLKPDCLTYEEAVLFGCALATGAGIVKNELNLNSFSSVLIIGLGGIGLSALMMLQSLMIKNISVIDNSDKKLALAKSWGVKNLIKSDNDNVIKILNDISPNGFDFCIESAGKVETIEMGFSFIKKGGGKLVFASHPPNDQKISLFPHDLISGKEIKGSWGGSTKPDTDIPIMSKILLPNISKIRDLLTKKYSLDQINVALSDLSSGRVFRPIIEMDHEE
jgi:S-(hydroxymethyl)glutathione dehydrogenase/alcohol dehydrogenase